MRRQIKPDDGLPFDVVQAAERMAHQESVKIFEGLGASTGGFEKGLPSSGPAKFCKVIGIVVLLVAFVNLFFLSSDEIETSFWTSVYLAIAGGFWMVIGESVQYLFDIRNVLISRAKDTSNA